MLLAQANQPILATMAAINTWALVHKGGLLPPCVELLPGARTGAQETESNPVERHEQVFTPENGFRAGSPLADWLRRVREAEFARFGQVLAAWCGVPKASHASAGRPVLPCAGVDPLALTAPAALRKRVDDFPTEPEIFLHE